MSEADVSSKDAQCILALINWGCTSRNILRRCINKLLQEWLY